MLKYSDYYIGKYIKIIDKSDNSIIASGKACMCKTDYINAGISLDYKWFFRETNRIHIEEVDFVEDIIFDDKSIERYNWEYWENNKKDSNIDIYRDYCYDEIDPEIKSFVDELNQIDSGLATTSSCSGHGLQNWFIEFRFGIFKSLTTFTNIVETFDGDLVLRTNKRSGDINKEFIVLRLEPTISDLDFKLLKRFISRLKRQFDLTNK